MKHLKAQEIQSTPMELVITPSSTCLGQANTRCSERLANDADIHSVNRANIDNNVRGIDRSHANASWKMIKTNASRTRKGERGGVRGSQIAAEIPPTPINRRKKYAFSKT